MFLRSLLFFRGAWILFAVTEALAAENGKLAYLNLSPQVKYVGSQVCAQCHPQISTQFRKTDMGRSMSLPDDSLLERVPQPVALYDKSIGRYFKVFRQGEEVYQREYELDSGGHEIFHHDEKIAYVVGTGENGFSFLIGRGDYLFQAPLSFYSKTGSWDLSPAHELGFTRPIEEGCIACHSGRPQPVPNRRGLYRRPAFSELAIGCENCHGPGQLHVDARLRGEPLAGEADLTVVNPARLPAWLADNICMSCHEKGDAEILQPGKNYLDFRPGTPLDETLAVFKMPLKPGASHESPLLNHYFLMTLSECYRRSGRLSCLSCHDPHYQPPASEASSYYRKKCLSCHSTGSCSLPLTARRTTTPPDDCVGCHMPARSLTTISHSALTDHRIPARPGEPFPADVSQAVSAGIPGLIHLTAAPGRDDVVPPLTLLRAYADLAGEGPTYPAQFRRLLAQVARREPSNPLVLGLLARDALTEAQPGGSGVQGRGKPSGAELEAIGDLERAIRLGSTWVPDYELLGQLLARAGRFEDAIAILDRGIALAPYTPSLYPLLSDCYRALGNRQAARDTLQNGLKLFPEDAMLRELSDTRYSR